MRFSIFTDGGARGNPGPSAVGFVIKDVKGNTVKEMGKYIGKATNNEAEYSALIEGLSSAVRKGVKDIDCFLDSTLVVNQLNGNFKVKNIRIKKLWLKVKEIEKNFKSVSYCHIPREKNFEADALVNEVLDSIA